MIRFVWIVFLILFVNIHATATIAPSGGRMRSVFSEKSSTEQEKEKPGSRMSGYLKADYLVYLVLIASGAYILIRKRKSKNIHL